MKREGTQRQKKIRRTSFKTPRIRVDYLRHFEKLYTKKNTAKFRNTLIISIPNMMTMNSNPTGHINFKIIKIKQANNKGKV